jgi:hypothetical protein
MEQDVMERDVATNRPGHFPKPSTDPLASNAAGKIAGRIALADNLTTAAGQIIHPA